MKRFTLGIDLDDTAFPLLPTLIKWHNTHYGTINSHEHLLGYYDRLADMWGCDEVETRRRFDQFTQEFNHLMVPAPRAQEIIRKLAEYYNLVGLSSRHWEIKDPTLESTDTFFAGCFDHVQLCSVNYKQLWKKSHAGLTFGIHVLIDDHFHHIEDCLQHGIKGVLFGDCPWNRHIKTLPAGVVRAYTWEEVPWAVRTVLGLETVRLN